MSTSRDPPPESRSDQYVDLVSDVLDHAKERAEARANPQEAPGARVRRRLSALNVVLLGASFVGVVGLNIYMLNRPPEEVPAAVQEVDLRYIVAGVVEVVEGFRETEGRLPSVAEMRDYVSGEGDVRYRPVQGGYRVVAETDDVRLVYDGSVPLAEWLADRTYIDSTEVGR